MMIFQTNRSFVRYTTWSSESMSRIVYIKNMVCPRCIESVGEVFNDLNVAVKSVALGEVTLADELSQKELLTIGEQLKTKGFELLEDQNSQLIGKIKSLIIQQIHHSKERMLVNFSTFLAQQLHHDYSSLSRLFSSVEGVTIEKFILKQKIEKVKELIFYNELNLSEIAHQMKYSSVAHLSSQFKKETGMTPSEFKKIRSGGRQSLDEI